MSQFRDLIARMAIDAEFARHARANPDAVARQYGLTSEETEQLRGLADAAAGAGPTALGARLSKSGGTFGGVVTTLAADLDLTPQADPPAPPPVPQADLLAQLGGPEPPQDSGPLTDVPPADPPPPAPGPLLGKGVDLGQLLTPEPQGDGGGESPPQLVLPNLMPDLPEFIPTPSGEGGGSDPTPSPGGFGDLAPWADSDGDGIPNAMDQQPSNPDTSEEPFADNDGDGIPNMFDETPDGDAPPTFLPGIDLSDLLQPTLPGPQFPGGLDFGDLFPGGEGPADPGPGDPAPADPGPGDPAPADPAEPEGPSGELGEPPLPPAAEPATPPAPTTPPAPATPAPAAPSAPVSNQDSMAAADVPPEPVIAAEPIGAGGALAGAAQQPPALDPIPAPEDGIGTSELMFGGAGLVAGAVAGGVAGAATGKALAGKGQEEQADPAQPQG